MKNDKYLLYPCGSIVKTKYGKIDGMITAQLIKFDNIVYEISYFDSKDQKTIWMNEREFETCAERQVIGYK